ncbi:Uma2 family endonuclease [Nocardiopsis sp. NPDC049922]|uniref:Uma2 family endonuclease n=1 Tax=Nocardiopsis sp. NPDC049922 TaxID=3155157 RepID=UPI0034030F93
MTEPPVQEGPSRWDYLLRTWQELDVPDGWRAEILNDNGVVLVPPPSDPHNIIASLVHRVLVRSVPDEWHVFQTLGVQVSAVERLYVPDVIVMPEDVVLDPSQSPSPAEEASLVVEIVSRSSMSTDRDKKLWGYAYAPVPLYLLIDAFAGEGPSVTLYERPGNGRYNRATTVEFGDKISLPMPFNLELDTSRFPGPDKW